MQGRQVFSSYFTDRVAAIDFEHGYSPGRRILLHGLMWAGFALLLFLSYRMAYHLTYTGCALLTLRMTTVNMAVFYVFFYAILPVIFRGSLLRTIVLLVLAFPVLVILWLLLTYAWSLTYHAMGFEISAGELKGAIGASAAQTLLQAIGITRMVSQAIIIISVLAPFFFVKILFEISRLYSRTLKMQRRQVALEVAHINMEKDFLKAQLNPHFLFNTLNNLYSLSLQQSDRVPDMILDLSDTMSYTLYESNAEKVDLLQEIVFVRHYAELEKLRYAPEKDIRFHFPSEAECVGLRIAPLLTFTFIENAFKYGLKSREEAFLDLHIGVTGRRFYFTLENDRDPGQQQEGPGGIGQENARKRLQLLYPATHELLIAATDKRFKVHLEIEL